MMRVMVFVKATEDSERGVFPNGDAFEAMDRFNEELVAARVMLAGAGLRPTAQPKCITFDGPTRTVIDGPFAPACSQVAGFWLWKVRDMDDAVAWAKRCPNPMAAPSELEIRPFYEMADLAEFLKPDNRGRLGTA